MLNIDIKDIHKQLCEQYQFTYKPEAIVADLRGNSGVTTVILSEMLGGVKEAQIVSGYYHGRSVTNPGVERHQHIWINHNGLIYDANRWEFQGEEPYLFIGDPIGDTWVYEEAALYVSIPGQPPVRKEDPSIKNTISHEAAQFLYTAIFHEDRSVDYLTPAELTYLTKLPYQYLLTHLIEIYTFLIDKGYKEQLSKQALQYYLAVTDSTFAR